LLPAIEAICENLLDGAGLDPAGGSFELAGSLARCSSPSSATCSG
jgi:hypothetical protein